MQRALLLLGAALVALSGTVAFAPWVAAQPTSANPCRAPVECLAFDTVVEWQTGLAEDLLISNNDGGELRLAEKANAGNYTTGYTQANTPFGAIGATWSADIPQGTSLVIEVRSGSSADQTREAAWQPLDAADARSQLDAPAYALKATLPVAPGTSYIQMRARFTSEVENASPVLSKLTLALIAPVPGPGRSTGMPRVASPYGPATLTNPPLLIQRASWDPNPPTTAIARQAPRGVLIHQIGANDLDDSARLAFLRSTTLYNTQVLGWDDLPFHFVIDPGGQIFEGRLGGPTAYVPRLAGGDAAVQIALLGSGTPSEAATTALTGLLAWLGQAYAIAPLGQHSVAKPSDGAAASRPNIATQAEVVPAAASQAAELRAAMAALRQTADQQTVRARWYFAEGNPRDYRVRLSVLNPAATAATVRFRLLRSPGVPIVRSATVEPNGRAELQMSDVLTDTTDVPAIVEANTPIVAERLMDTGSDLTASPGMTRLSRVWYFAEGATDGDNKTYLVLFNPQEDDAEATITYMRSDGTTAELKAVKIPARRRTVVVVGDALPDAQFGTRVIATRPIAAERTMTFGPAERGGVHTAPGVVGLSRRWYFAEGTTAPPFQMRLLVLNPNAQPVTATVTFLTDSGTSLTRRYAIPATSRLAINVNDVVPELGVATRIEVDRPVVVERAMYWRNGSAGAASPGAVQADYGWRFADGRTNDDFQEFLLFNNPDKNYQARVTVDFVLADGSRATQAVVMPGGSRYTMAVHELYPGQAAISATVRSTHPIIAERAFYAGAPASEASRGGATSLGVPEATP